jgi:hypothetical protein
MTPDAQLTQQERACCRMMKDQCGQMGMPASHSCCQKDIQSANHDARQAKSVNIHPDIAVTPHLFIADLSNPSLVSAGWVEHPEFSPPHFPPNSISVLRI